MDGDQYPLQPFSLSEVEGQAMNFAKLLVLGVHFDFAQCERRLLL